MVSPGLTVNRSRQAMRGKLPGAVRFWRNRLITANSAGKGAAAVDALYEYDLVCVHIEAPDEAGHNGNVRAKIDAIEAIDRHIVGPVAAKLASFQEQGRRVLILPDHPTPIAVRSHTEDPVPWAMAGTGVTAVVSAPFDEESAARSDLKVARGWELMEYFLKER